MDSVFRLVRGEGAHDPGRSRRTLAGARRDDRARAARRRPAARSSSFRRARGARPAPSRNTSSASPISIPNSASRACRSRSIPGCSGRAGRSGAIQAWCGWSFSIRSRPGSTARSSSTGCRARSRPRRRSLWRWRRPRSGRANALSLMRRQDSRVRQVSCGPFSRSASACRFGVAAAEAFELGDRRQHIIGVGARTSVPLPDQMQPLIERELAGILRMAAIDHIGQRLDPAVRVAEQRHVAQHLEIDRGHLLALAQIGDRGARDRRRRRGRRCRGRRRRGRARAQGPASPACRDGRRNRRRASGAARSPAPAPSRERQSPAATAASRSRKPTNLRGFGRWQLHCPREMCGLGGARANIETPYSATTLRAGL